MDIKKIAKLAGTSTGTVDRVLHKRGGVAEKTKLKIEKIIEETNFKPNYIARHLALKKKINIAIIIPDTKRTPFWEILIKGISDYGKEIESMGVYITFFYHDQFDVIDFENVLKQAYDQKPSGLIIVPSFIQPCKKWLPSFQKKNIPYFFLNINVLDNSFTNLAFFGDNSFKSGFIAGKIFNILLQKYKTTITYKNILIVERKNNPARFSNLHQRSLGFMNFFETNKLPVNIKIVEYENPENDFKTENQFRQKLSKVKADGIFVPSERVQNIVNVMPKSKHKIIIAGYDLTPRNKTLLQKEIIDFIIDQESYTAGYQSVKTMFEYLVKGISVEKINFSPTHIYFKEHLMEI